MIKKQLIILSDIDLNKFSSAAYPRMICYAKALGMNGITTILTTTSSDLKNLYRKSKNIWISKQSTYLKSKLYTLILKHFDIKSNLRYCMSVYKLCDQQNYNSTFLLYPYSLASILCTLVYFRLLKRNKIFIEKNELQFALYMNYPYLNGVFQKILYTPIYFTNIFIGLLSDLLSYGFTGIIVISTSLKKFYKIKKKITLIPIIVDIARFKHKSKEKKHPVFQIGFVGSLADKKDKIFVILDTVKSLNSNGIKADLNLFGPASNTTINKLYKKIKKLRIENNVHYYGQIGFDNIPEILAFQDILLLIRPKNLQNKYGFSTKLAEYLASGVPVLTSNVGDIPLYLEDNKSAFIIDKNDLSSLRISSRLITLIKEPSLIKKVSKCGFEVCKSYFNYTLYSNSLLNLLFDDN